MIWPARQEPLQDARRGRFSRRHAAADADHIGHLVAVAAEEFLGGPEELLGRGDIEVEQARQRQVDGDDFVEIDAVVEAAQFIEVDLRQRHGRVGAEL